MHDNPPLCRRLGRAQLEVVFQLKLSASLP